MGHPYTTVLLLGGWVTPSQLEIRGDADSSTLVRRAQFQITGISTVGCKCCLHLYVKWFGINDIGSNEEQLFCTWKDIWTPYLDRLVLLHQVLSFPTLMSLENTVGTFLSVQVPEIFLRWITLGHEFLLMLQSHVSMEQRENALSSGQARLQGDMLLCLKVLHGTQQPVCLSAPLEVL